MEGALACGLESNRGFQLNKAKTFSESVHFCSLTKIYHEIFHLEAKAKPNSKAGIFSIFGYGRANF